MVALDGNATAAGSGSVSSVTITLTTTSSPDVIILEVASDRNIGTVTVADQGSAGLTFTQRGATWQAVSGCFMQEWQAIANAPLSSEQIKVSSSSPGFTALLIFGISGANTSTVFDPNASLPAVHQFNTGTNALPIVTGISTTNANDFVYALFVSNNGPTESSAGTLGGVNMVFIQSTLGNQYGSDEYLVVSSTQSNVSATFGVTTTNNYIMIADAVEAAAAAPSGGYQGASIIFPARRRRRM